MEMNYKISQKNVLSAFSLSVQVVSDFIETKTVVDDRSHATLVNNEVFVNLALATSQADLYWLNSLFFEVRLITQLQLLFHPLLLVNFEKMRKMLLLLEFMYFLFL